MSSWSGTRVFVTGAAGFIGANLTRELVDRGAEVHALVSSSTDRRRIDGVAIDVHNGDATDVAAVSSLVASLRPRVIFHLAAAGGHPRDEAGRTRMVRAAVLGTHAAIEAAARTGCRVVYTGSSLEYRPTRATIDESTPIAPVCFRGLAKALAGLRALSSPDAVTLRPFRVYGPLEQPGRLVPRAILAAFSGSELPLTRPGVAHDFVYVDDVVQALLLAATAPGVTGRAINIGSGANTTNEEVVALIESLTGSPIAIRAGAYPVEPHDTSIGAADISLAHDLLGWRPRHSLRTGIEKTLAFTTAEPATIP